MASNVRVNINAQDNASGKIKGLTGSFLKANLAVMGLQKVFGLLSTKFTETVNKGRDFEEISSKLNAVFSTLQGTANKMALDLAQSYGLSVRASKEMLSATGDLLTGFGFSQQKALELSEATLKLGTDLASFTNLEGGADRAVEILTKGMLGQRQAMKSLGIAILDTDIKTRLAEKGMDKLTGEALRQAKAQITLELAMEQSKNAIGDFQRTQDSLANRQRVFLATTEDIQTQIGKFLIPVMKEITQTAIDGAQAFKEMITSSKGINAVSNIFAGLTTSFTIAKKLFTDIGAYLGKVFGKEITKIKNELGEFFQRGLKTNQNMSIFAGILKIVGIGLTIAVRLVGNFINYFINLGTVVKEIGGLIADFFSALINPKKWGDFKKQLKRTGDSFKDLVVDLGNNYKDLITDVIDQAKTFPSESKKSADEFINLWTDTYTKQKQKFIEEAGLIGNEQDSITENTDENSKKQIEITKTSLENMTSFYTKFSNEVSNILGTLGNTIAESFTKTFNVFLDETATIGDKIASTFSSVGSIIAGGLDVAGVAINDFFTRQLDELKTNLSNQLESINEFYSLQKELIENDGVTKEEAMINNITRLQEELAQATEISDQERLQDELREAQKNLTLLNLDKKQKSELEKANKDSKKKEHELAVKQFNANKALQITQAIISGAVGIATTWATAMQLGPIAGPIAGGIISALITGITAAQVGIIASQQPPSANFEQGGIIPGNSLTGDRITVGGNSGEAILRADDFNMLVNKIREPGSFNTGQILIDKLIVQTENVDDLRQQLILLQEQEFARI